MSYLLKSRQKFLVVTEDNFSVALNLVKTPNHATAFATREQAETKLKEICEKAKEQIDELIITQAGNYILDIESISDYLNFTIYEQPEPKSSL